MEKYIIYKLITKIHTNKHGHKENILFKRRTKIFYFLHIFIFIKQTHNKKRNNEKICIYIYIYIKFRYKTKKQYGQA